ncbi:MAG: lactonase family protein [Kiritimatiellae bacterium]|nr:lactonase family protein [Kiritimatiellia bacterium]
MIIYLGSYTDGTHPNGLKVLNLDEATGQMSVADEYPVSNALYQDLSPDGRTLFSCTGEGLAAFRVNGDRLLKIDEIKVGSCVCHIAVMPKARRVVFADYLGGFAGDASIDDEGRFGVVVCHQHTGSGPNLPRQDKAHCHQAMPAPDGKSYCVVDLGTDEIVTYPEGRKFKTPPPGAGPRHLLFHPNGRLAFLVYELGNLVSSLRWDAKEGFSIIDTLPTLAGPAKKDSPSLAAAVRFTPDMKRIVVSNRGENSLAAYDYDEKSGKISFKARTLLTGSWPRDFIFVTDTLALVAMERSGEVHALRYHPESGEFTIVSTLNALFRPVALTKFQSAKKFFG